MWQVFLPIHVSFFIRNFFHVTSCMKRLTSLKKCRVNHAVDQSHDSSVETAAECRLVCSFHSIEMKFFQQVLKNILEYCDDATIGVLKYISRRSSSKLGRIFWLLCVFIAFVCSIFLIEEGFKKFLKHKIAIKLSDNQNKVSEIPFPALTICPETILPDVEYSEIFLNQEL